MALASKVKIDFLRQDTCAYIKISDNGIGMNAHRMDTCKGIGCKNLFSRVALLWGKIDLRSVYTKGATIVGQLSI
ncbi:hypothetical protein ACFQ1M_10570 [Sungkyunkwania multivorans]|uniref:Histidine kinase/HSP90-like ATPase domain-containing protein n=1 Tax=Sungkyunkwania multivorans TaxID=1173618 RepID=A0ABW3CZK2_9FLAO